MELWRESERENERERRKREIEREKGRERKRSTDLWCKLSYLKRKSNQVAIIP